MEWAQWSKETLRGFYSTDVDHDNAGNLLVCGYKAICMGGCIDGFVTKYSSSGIKRFNLNLSNSSTMAFAKQVECDDSSNIYVYGYSGGYNITVGNTILIDTNIIEDFLIKLDSNGIVIWFLPLNGSYTNASLCVDEIGNSFILTNTSVRCYNSNGILIWQNIIAGNLIDVNSTSLIIGDTLNNIIFKASKFSGIISQSINTSDLKDLGVDDLNNIFYTGSNGTFKISNSTSSLFTLDNGTAIKLGSNSIWLSKEVSTPSYINTTLNNYNYQGQLILTDTLTNTVGAKFSINNSGLLFLTGNLSDPILYGKWGEFIINSDISYNYNGFIIGRYNPTSGNIRLNFSEPFWDPNNYDNGHWIVKRCAGGNVFPISFKLYNGIFNSNNIVLVELSDSTGSFNTPYIIGALATNNSVGVINCQLPSSLTNSINYKIRLAATSPSLNSLQVSHPLDISLPITNIFSDNNSSVFCSKSVKLNVNIINNSNYCCGNTFQWQRNGVNISGAIGITFSPSLSGTYRCITTDYAGCSKISNNSLPITTLPLPNATITPAGNKEICVEDSLLISASSSVGSTFQWYRNNSIIASQNNSLLWAKKAGYYKVIVTGQNGCSKTSKNVNLSVFKPSIQSYGPTTFCSGSNVVLGTNTVGATAWQWMRNNIDITSANSQIYVANLSGSYKVRATAVSGCSANSNSITVSVNCRESNEEKAIHLGLSIYPNPASENIEINYQTYRSGKVALVVLDGIGSLQKIIEYSDYKPAGFYNLKISALDLPSGIYILRLVTADSNENVRMVIAK